LAAAQANVKSLEESIAATQAKGSDSAKLRTELTAMEDRLGAMEEELRYVLTSATCLSRLVHLARRHKSGVAQQLHSQKSKLEQDLLARKQEVEEERKQMQAMIAQLTESLNAETAKTKTQVRVHYSQRLRPHIFAPT
jgi:chromosome segregation ATPase